MNIGIITLSRIRAEQGTFYNFQDIGLARALADAGHCVTLYRLTEDADKTDQSDGVFMIYRKTMGIGKQALTGFGFIDENVDRLICFSDNQVSFPGLYDWCRERGILLQPYIGVLNSNSSNAVVRKITDFLVWRNIRLYRSMKVYGKTPAILEVLRKFSIEEAELVPVCLNQELLHEESGKDETDAARAQYGFERKDKILLFIGRMEAEKEPLAMVSIFAELYRQHSGYRLIMVGQGVLYEAVKHAIDKLELNRAVLLMEKVTNREIWKLYNISSCYINLNCHEIYGMSVLEAMYYRCPVVAMRAPGPEYLIQQEKTGYLCETFEQLKECVEEVVEGKRRLPDTRDYVKERFFWESAVRHFVG